MRFIFGIVVGAILLVGAAYIHDASIEPGPEASRKTLVNWDVASQAMRGVNAWLQDEWVWLNEKFHGPA